MLLVAVATTCAFTACDNDDDNGKKYDPLAGSYVLTTVEKDNGGTEPNQQSLTITPTWSVDEKNLPNIDASVMMGYPAGSVLIPLDDLIDMMNPLLSRIVSGGLVRLDLNRDGTLGAQYHEFISQGDIAKDMMFPKFAEAVSTFPAEGDPLPADALQYYSKDGKLFFGVSKAFLNALDDSLCAMIDGMLTQNPTLPVVSTETLFALPLKYTLTGTTLKVYLDRATLAPIAALLPALLQLVGNVDLGGFDVEALVKGLIESTSELEIAIYLKPAL